VIHPSRGDVPFIDSLFGHAMAALMPHVALLTPNIQELAFLTGARIESAADAAAVGQALADKLATAVLVKGGHLAAPGDEVVDYLCWATSALRLAGPRIANGEHVHGTGCALSSAIAAHLAHGADLVEACRAAKAFVAARIAAPAHPGRGAAAIL